MDKKMYFLISGLIFAIVAIAHLFRIINQSSVYLGTWPVPMMGSWVCVFVAGALSYCGFKLMGKVKGT